MKICVRLSDPMLARALIDVLRSRGHEVTHLSHGSTPCSLRIQSEGSARDSVPGCPILVLRRTPDRSYDPDPAAALRKALGEGGVAVWRAPLDVRLLLEVLDGHGGAPDAAALDAVPAPDLSRAPHAWLVVDVVRDLVLAANAEARMVLDLDPEEGSAALADLPIAGALRETIQEESEGLRSGEVAGSSSTAAWWTDEHGRRIVCFLEVPKLQSQAARNRQSLAALGQMAATLAHEIRNPVASLAGALDLLESEEDPIDRAEILELAHDRLKQLSRLLEKTLNLARPITGPTEEVELDAVIGSAVSTLTLDPRFQHIVMDVDLPEEEIRVLALAGPLLQALTNLLLNAAQAQNGHGRIKVQVTRDTRRALIRIHDEGPGIPEERRLEIFKPFYTTKPAGTGLGLAEVRRAMEAVGGAVIVEPAEEGACFRLEVPLAPPA